jgi:hypothetical protein
MGYGFGEQGQFVVSGCAFNGPQVQLGFRSGATGGIDLSLLIHRISSIDDIILAYVLISRRIFPGQPYTK